LELGIGFEVGFEVRSCGIRILGCVVGFAGLLLGVVAVDDRWVLWGVEDVIDGYYLLQDRGLCS
jgi:hypothetical protein